MSATPVRARAARRLALAWGVLLLGAAPACRSGTQGAATADAPSVSPRVMIDAPSGRRSTVAVEVARTPAEVERGLMFRERLAPDAGMLFVFPDTSEHTFWMKNTLIPLDMIFADADGTVVGVVADAAPLTETGRSVGVPSRYVLEVNGGWAAAHGVARGDRLRFEGIANAR